MADNQVHEPYNIFYFLAFLVVLALPTLPAILTWLRVVNDYARF
ncbi:hypothetical protein [Vibrio agarilyticus]|nr:hypothetical protein [Vibrio agarilyticus]